MSSNEAIPYAEVDEFSFSKIFINIKPIINIVFFHSVKVKVFKNFANFQDITRWQHRRNQNRRSYKRCS